MELAPGQASYYLEQDMDEVAEFGLATGTACVYTLRSPGKESPNEDSIGLACCSGHEGVLVVADGMGGLRAGELASALAVRSVGRSALKCGENGVSLREAVLDGVEQANQAVSNLGLGAGTTLAVVEIAGNEVRSYHVGDSMILVTGQRGRLRHQTVSHSPVGYAVEAGFLDAEEAMHHEERHLISNVVGSPEMRVEMGPTVKMAARDTLLLASDGLFDNLHQEEIVEIIRKGPLRRAATGLAQACRERMSQAHPEQPHKPDDLAFILFRLRRL